MINKNSFVKIMNTLRDYDDGLCEFEKRLGVVFEDNWIVNVFDNVLDALFEDMEEEICPEDADPIIYHYAFFCEWGRAEDASIEINGVWRSLRNAEELYDLLVELKEGAKHGK